MKSVNALQFVKIFFTSTYEEVNVLQFVLHMHAWFSAIDDASKQDYMGMHMPKLTCPYSQE